MEVDVLGVGFLRQHLHVKYFSVGAHIVEHVCVLVPTEPFVLPVESDGLRVTEHHPQVVLVVKVVAGVEVVRLRHVVKLARLFLFDNSAIKCKQGNFIKGNLRLEGYAGGPEHHLHLVLDHSTRGRTLVAHVGHGNLALTRAMVEQVGYVRDAMILLMLC